MNIAFFFNDKIYPPKAGGTVHAYQIASNLTKRGHTVCSIFYDYPSPMLKNFRRSEFFKFLNFIDVVYVRLHGTFGQELYTLLKVLTFLKKPVVWEINAPLEEGLSMGRSALHVKTLAFLRKNLARTVNAATCVTKEIEEYAKAELKIKNTYVVPNGSDPELFTPAKRRNDLYKEQGGSFKVIWAGTTYFNWHGFDVIEKIARKIYEQDKGITFILIGDKKGVLSPNELPPNMFFMDKKGYLELPEYIASADLGLCFYHTQPGLRFYRSPLKLFDYMSCGLPVLATDIGQISEAVQNGKDGFLLKDNNIDDAVRHILFLKNNPALAQKMGQEGRKKVEEYYNWARAAEETEKVFRSVITKR